MRGNNLSTPFNEFSLIYFTGLSSEDHHECRPTEGHIIINFDMTETKKKVSEEKFSRQISSMRYQKVTFWTHKVDNFDNNICFFQFKVF